MSASIELGRLAAKDLGKTLTVEYELATFTGALSRVEHSKYSDTTPSRTSITIKRDGWHWSKSLDSNTTVEIEGVQGPKTCTCSEFCEADQHMLACPKERV